MSVLPNQSIIRLLNNNINSPSRITPLPNCLHLLNVVPPSSGVTDPVVPESGCVVTIYEKVENLFFILTFLAIYSIPFFSPFSFDLYTVHHNTRVRNCISNSCYSIQTLVSISLYSGFKLVEFLIAENKEKKSRWRKEKENRGKKEAYRNAVTSKYDSLNISITKLDTK